MANTFLLPASFRGIPFRVSSIETTFGRRNQLHEYPLRDEPYAEDLGKKAREYTINAYVIGNNYTFLRDALIRAIETNKTPGQLIHPTLGIKTVIPRDCREIFNNTEGRVEYFELTFVEAGVNLFPNIFLDTQGAFHIARAASIASLVSQFSSSFSIAKVPEFVRAAASVMGIEVAESVVSVVSMGVVSAEVYSAYLTEKTRFRSNLPMSIQNSPVLGASISELVSGLTALYANPFDAYESQKTLAKFGENIPPVKQTTPNRRRQAQNQEAVIQLIKSCALIEMTHAISKITFDNVNDALAIREELSDAIDHQMSILANLGSDAQYLALADIKTAILEDINQRSLTLSSLIEVPIQDSVPALVFAYNQYADAERDQEIADRNNIRHPLFFTFSY